MWQREDRMDVARGQQFLFPRLNPAVAGIGLALGAMPIPARVEGDDLSAAAGALIYVSAQRGSPATQNGTQHF